MTLKLCSIAAAIALAFGLTAAQAQTGTAPTTPRADTTTGKVKDTVRERKVKDAEEDRIEAEYKSAKAKCDEMKNKDEKEVCEADAKGKEKVAKAELEQKYEPSDSHARKVDEAKAEHEYNVAKEKCDVAKGKEESACEKEAKAKYERAKADIKARFASKERKAATGSTSK